MRSAAPSRSPSRPIDTLAPAITALQIAGTVRAGAQITITPTVTGTDVQRIDYLIGNTASR